MNNKLASPKVTHFKLVDNYRNIAKKKIYIVHFVMQKRPLTHNIFVLILPGITAPTCSRLKWQLIGGIFLRWVDSVGPSKTFCFAALRAGRGTLWPAGIVYTYFYVTLCVHFQNTLKHVFVFLHIPWYISPMRWVNKTCLFGVRGEQRHVIGIIYPTIPSSIAYL